MLDDAGALTSEDPWVDPRAPLGHLSRLGFALRNSSDIDGVARSLLVDLAELPDVTRVGLGLIEGAGRRLRFVATEDLGAAPLEWCHIDAYDDLPLTAVARTGEPVLGSLDALAARFPDLVANQREAGGRALAAWPLPGAGTPVGGLVVFFDREQEFPEAQRRLFEAAARRTSEAIRRVRSTSGRGPGDAAADDPALIGQGERASVLLESDVRAAGAARQFLRDQLAHWAIDDDTVDSAELCLSELVTNAVIHARTTSELTLHLEDGVLTVVVRDLGGSSDSGRAVAHPRLSEDEDPLRVFGRGLTLVDALADRWGTERDPSGTTAWFVLELDSQKTPPAQTG